MNNERWNVVSGLGLFVLGFIAGFFINEASAHYTPCDYQEPDCHYIQVVNPITGILEQQYVCT